MKIKAKRIIAILLAVCFLMSVAATTVSAAKLVMPNTGKGNEVTKKVITENNNGGTISIKKGDTFYLKLRGNPSTGYSWKLDLSKGLNILSDDYTQDPAPEHFHGVPGTYQWEMKAVTSGSQQVKGIYIPPGGKITGKKPTFKINIKVL